MFGAVMADTEICRQTIECILGIEIDYVVIDTEKSIIYNPNYHGVRLDAFAKDPAGTCFSIEMQVAKTDHCKRARYYHSQIDVELLLSGISYSDLPDCYVIFICDYDPFGLGKYRYTMCQSLAEVNADLSSAGQPGKLPYDDGTHTIFLNTTGHNEAEVPPALVNFLRFIHNENDEAAHKDAFVQKLESRVSRIKENRVMRSRYMNFKELLDEEKRLGHEEGRAEGLAEGRAEGRAQGLAEGRAEGRAESEAMITEMMKEINRLKAELAAK